MITTSKCLKTTRFIKQLCLFLNLQHFVLYSFFFFFCKYHVLLPNLPNLWDIGIHAAIWQLVILEVLFSYKEELKITIYRNYIFHSYIIFCLLFHHLTFNYGRFSITNTSIVFLVYCNGGESTFLYIQKPVGTSCSLQASHLNKLHLQICLKKTIEVVSHSWEYRFCLGRHGCVMVQREKLKFYDALNIKVPKCVRNIQMTFLQRSSSYETDKFLAISKKQ